jgi:hypothetical protein
MKICHRCKESKPLTEFNLNRAKVDGYASTCRACMKVYRKEHYHKYKKKVIVDVLCRRDDIRKEIWEYKASHSCIDCGESDPVVIDFDHLEDKEFNISHGVARGFSINRIMKEIEKCDVVCANCHRRRTYSRAHQLYFPLV